ncbi:MAG: DinB family protein [Chloroflexi bacterium]|nr:DinB family protein [Chloroflexota bacterium]
MRSPHIRPAYSSWPVIDQALRDVVAELTPAQLAIQPTPERWPLWATIGHLACQRVSWLCGFLGEPGAETTPFPDALYSCPGDEDLEHVLDAAQLMAALASTFAIVERVLDTWTMDMLDEVVRRTFGTDEWVHTRGFVIQRVFAHDISHITEVNEILGRAGLRQVDLWP